MVVVSGVVAIVNNDKNMLVRTNKSTYIPAIHNIALNKSPRLSGQGEGNIVRIDDMYGRYVIPYFSSL